MSFYLAYTLAKFQTIKNIEVILILQKLPKCEFLSRPYTCKIQKIKNIKIIRNSQKSSKYEFYQAYIQYTYKISSNQKSLRLFEFRKNCRNMNFYQA